ncbi:MAG: T9SS type A sorting domain-containing protein [Candidatus Cloacimonetes bacterium]|nr:T9SS type A sorting domain-containing protein [Candidatus Cloacimonadota bacterium]
MKSSFLILIIFLLVNTLNGEWITMQSPATTECVTYNHNERGNISLQFTLDGYEREQISHNGISYTGISYASEGTMAEVGMPDLPVFTRLIAVPDQGEISARIIVSEYEIISDVTIYPQGEFLLENEPERDAFCLNENYYQTGGLYPESPVMLGEPAIMRDLRVVKVSFCPFRYDAASKELYVYSNIEIELTATEREGINVKIGNSKFSRSLAGLYKSSVLNFEEIAATRDDFQQPSILIIYPNVTGVGGALEYLADWKRKKGFEVTLVHTGITGTSNSSIKSYVQNAYNTWENAPEYLILVGDVNYTLTIPTWYDTWSGGNGVGDHPYAQLEGNDVLADIIVGRISVASVSELQTVISKAINYERDPYLTNTDWYEKGIMFAYGGPGKIATCETVEEYMRSYNANYTFSDIYYSGWVYNLDQELNAGAGYLCYRSQGTDAGWGNNNINGLNNGWMLPFGALITCFTGDFGNYGAPSLSEAFVSAGSSSLPKGGIAAVGTSTGLTSGCFNNCVTQGIFYGIFVDNIFTPGGALLRGKMNLYLQYPNNPLNHVNTWSHCNNLIGDPSIDLWTGIPQPMIVNYAEEIYVGTNFLEFSILTEAGIPLENAWITVRGEDFYQSGYSDQNGIYFLDLEDAEINQDYEITVTSHDKIPFENEFTVVQAAVNLDVAQIIYNDIGGDGIPNPGEEISLELIIVNYGSEDVSDIEAELISYNSNISVTTAASNIGNIATGEYVINSELSIYLDPALVWGENSQLDLVLSNENDSWTLPIFIPVESALLNPVNYVVASANGILDPGETAGVYFNIENLGQITASDVYGELLCNDNRIEILISTGYFGNIPSGGTFSNNADMFEIASGDEIIPGTQITIRLHFTNSDGYDNMVSFLLEIGEISQDDPLGPDEYGYYCYDDGDTDYEDCPVYDWIEINNIGTDLEIFTYGDSATLADVELPQNFHFSFYGIDYDMLTVATAGWICPGGSDAAVFMNWIIPGPGGPSPMIAAFWDDLHNGNGDVYSWFDPAEHLFIIEWDNMENEQSNLDETFQIILYDADYYVTTSGDSRIKIQYKEFANSNMGEYPYHGANHGQYCTVGIENETGIMGLQYTYNNQYPTAAKILTDETAILFTAAPIPANEPFITISDYVIYAGDDEFIEAGEQVDIDLMLQNIGNVTAHNVTIEITEDDQYIEIVQSSTTAQDIVAGGTVTLDSDLIISALYNVPDYYSFELEVLISSEAASWNRKLMLTAYQPNFLTVDQDSIFFTLQPLGTGSHQFTLSNTGNVGANFYIRTDETTLPQRDISGSLVTMDTDSFTPGEETTWNFTVFNQSPDSEWLSDIWLEFPVGVTVITASDIAGGSGGDLIWDDTTGAGVTLNWHGTTSNGWGNIHDGEYAFWSVDVQLGTEFAGDMTIGWIIGGDGYGEEPHSLSGEIILLYPLRWMNLDTSAGFLEPGASELITINFDSNEIETGIYTGDVVVTTDSWDTQIINVVLEVAQVNEEDDLLPKCLELIGNYPNPFNPETEIRFRLPEAADVSLYIYNIKGQLVKKLVEQQLPAGTHSMIWNGKDENTVAAATGIYFFQLKTGNFAATGKMVLLK